jgi:hypothetical protein
MPSETGSIGSSKESICRAMSLMTTWTGTRVLSILNEDKKVRVGFSSDVEGATPATKRTK